ncbi:hypothetical protein D3C83_141270 [compost metagenome]
MQDSTLAGTVQFIADEQRFAVTVALDLVLVRFAKDFQIQNVSRRAQGRFQVTLDLSLS